MIREPIPSLPRIFNRRDQPIIRSFLDLDVYKLFMGQFVWRRHPRIKVRFGLKLRTKNVRLGDHIDIGRLKEELRECQKLRIGVSERQFLGGMFQYTPGQVLFQHDYLDFLANEVSLPDPHVEVRDGELIVEVESEWQHVIYWETIILAVVNELYFQDLTKDLGRFGRDALLSAGINGLKEKIEALKQLRRKFVFTYSEFGTRRRFCRDWQRMANAYMAEEVGLEWKEGYVGEKPFYRGTSNVMVAMECDVMSMGTMAHELFMVLAAVAGKESDEALLASHQKVIDEWLAFYGKGLSLILPDTFGSDHTFRTMTAEQAALINGFRQDSGKPNSFLEKEVAFFKRHGVDPSTKLGVPSDGIHIPHGLTDFLEGFAPRVDGTPGQLHMSPGMGTNWTNDFPGYKALSLVMKPIMADGAPTVKLSDDYGKGTGPEDEQGRYRRVFGYGGGITTAPEY